MDTDTKKDTGIQKELSEINKNLKALVNLMKFEMQNKYIESLRAKGFRSEDLGVRVDGYEKTLNEVARKKE